MSMRAVADNAPNATEAEHRTAWARLVYGDDLVKNLGIGS